MLKFFQKHMKSNRGDANVSKMTIIAIAFVVGAILLVLTTSAFRNPINRWFSNVTHGWFAEENGEFNMMLNQWEGYEKYDNGTLKGVKYVACVDGYYYLLKTPQYINHEKYDWQWIDCEANGNITGAHAWSVGGSGTISADGATIEITNGGWSGAVFEAIP